jgi:excisionase family DNA binding protein
VTARERLADVLAHQIVEAIEELVAERVAVEVECRRDFKPVRGAQWLTLDQAAQRLGCTPDAVRMRVNRGRLQHRKHGRRLYVSAESVDTLGGS